VLENHKLQEKNQFALMMDHMAECVRQNKEPKTPGEEGLRDVYYIERIYEAARAGRVVKVSTRRERRRKFAGFAPSVKLRLWRARSPGLRAGKTALSPATNAGFVLTPRAASAAADQWTRLKRIMPSTSAAVAVAAALLVALAGPSFAQTPATNAGSDSPGLYETPLGIGLEGVAYPHPVRYFDVEIEGRRERMAYMDVAPVGPRKRSRGRAAARQELLGGVLAGDDHCPRSRRLPRHRADQIGFGRSSKPDAIDYSFDLLAMSTKALLNSLKVEKAAVIGHSMGGMLAVRLARTYPEVFPQLVLENPIGLEDYRQSVPPATTLELIAGELKQTEEQIRRYRQAYFVRWLPAYERFVEVPARVRLSGEFPRWARSSALTSQMIYREPVVYDLPRVTQPSLLVIGQEDRTAIGKDRVSREAAATLGDYPKLGRAAAKVLPRATLVELKNVGTSPTSKHRTPSTPRLLKFLAAGADDLRTFPPVSAARREKQSIGRRPVKLGRDASRGDQENTL
jgi:pimeloyl-ACP methyl ester carboxylesterase